MKNTTRRLLAATVILALGAAVTACSGDSDSDSANEAAPPKTSAVVHGHVHGLGIDPSDGRIYVASHQGVFTLGEDGAARRVGTSRDDFMGFTVTKANTFLASGHPAQGTGGHSNHGLIQSTDAGRTWQPRSLTGEADFHSLEYAHGIIYGYDSTNASLRVSKDGSAWVDRAELQALDIAVSPADPDTVLATTADGVAKSADGGRTFAPGRQPVIAFLSWVAPRVLYGMDDSGGISRSTDGGSTWKQAGAVPGGQAQALTAVDAKRILAATQTGVYESKDGGETFTKLLSVEAGDGH
ncbi:sialidase family protein [Streptomyces sp. SCSIO 30461]|uniref:F510_1955 family glycosylhydrolase n=1 Tax=Streptomyces sp. SCSIO 30461 TaxID=3118085 RepID=UPI0030CD98A0